MTAETAVAQTESETESETVSSDAIERALNPPLTRGIRVETRANANAKVDLNIPFEINSSELRPQARQQLVQLETALQNDQLSKYRFEIAGHTDASGSAAYNRTLSRARAESVRQFLVDRGIDPDRLEVVGRGEDDLLHPDEPLHGANRRVEIRNLGEN
jgi:outer membrane protein OmpA-like peptidoglycan-associated protein